MSSREKVAREYYRRIVMKMYEFMDMATSKGVVNPGGGLDGKVAALRFEAMALCDKAADEIRADMANPMNEHAERWVELMRERVHDGNVHLSEIEAGLHAFGDNHAARRAIIDIARESGHKLASQRTDDEVLLYAFESVIKPQCRSITFDVEADTPMRERRGYHKLQVAAMDWSNNLHGYESLMGNRTGPLDMGHEYLGE